MSSLLGVHYLGRGADQSLLDGGMRVAKWVSNQPPDNLPAGTWVWRWYRAGDIVSDWWQTVLPADAARRYIDEQWEHIKFVPKNVAIEGQNEPGTYDGVRGDGQGVLRMRWYAQVEIERMKILDSLGYKACIGNFSTGRPDLPTDDNGAILREWEPAMRYAARHQHLFGSHEYGYRIDGFNLGRCQSIYAAMPADARPGYVCTEWGLDGADGQFRSDRWRAARPNPDAAYLDLMKAYDLKLRQTPYGRGFTVFTSGTNGDASWNGFDIAGQPIIGMMIDYIASQKDVVDPQGPTELPDTEEPPMTTNLLTNGSFEGGTHEQPGISGVLPDGWDISWADANTAKLPGQDQPWTVPEIITRTAAFVTDVPIPDGATMLKVFHGYAPIWVTLAQTKQVTPGRYRLSGKVWPDMVVAYNPKIYPKVGDSDDWYLSAEIGLTIGFDSPTYQNALTVPHGQWTLVSLEADIVATSITVAVGIRGRWGYANCGFFLDDFKLERIGDVGTTEPPPDTEEPAPTPGTLIDLLNTAEDKLIKALAAVHAAQAKAEAIDDQLGD